MQQWLNLLLPVATPVFKILIKAGTSHLLTSLQDTLKTQKKQQAEGILNALVIGDRWEGENESYDRGTFR